jgi:hypothetical protein
MRLISIVGLAMACACGSSGNASSDDDGGAFPNDAGQVPIDTDGGAGFAGGGPKTSDCAEAAKRFYVVTTEKVLYAFDPPSLAFNKIGLLDCPTKDPQTYPYTMSVDRSPKGWALYTDGLLYTFDLATAHCAATAYPYGAGLNDAGTSYRMKVAFGFAFGPGVAPGTERLYWEVLNEPSFPSTGLGWMDPASFAVTRIAPVDAKLNGWPSDELKVLSDGRMFAMAAATQANPKGMTFGELDPTTGTALSSTDLSTVLPSFNPTSKNTLNLAFASWGGWFWFFVGTDSKTTDVFRYTPPSGPTVKMTNVPIVISGSGESTCAPITPPN